MKESVLKLKEKQQHNNSFPISNYPQVLNCFYDWPVHYYVWWVLYILTWLWVPVQLSVY